MPLANIKRMPDLVPAPAEPIAPFLSQNRKLISQRDKTLRARTVRSLKGLQPLHFLPSFLLRTLNDFLRVEPAKLTRLQRATLSTWQRAGLGRKHAIEQIRKFYGLGVQGVNAIDKSYLTTKRADLDVKFTDDLKTADFAGFYDSRPLSPVRIADALASGADHSLTSAEQGLIKSLVDGSSFAQRRQKLLSLPRAAHWARPDDIKGTAPEPPTYYRMQARLESYHILESSDHVGGLADPCFLIYSFYNPYSDPAARPICQKITYNSLGDDVKPSDDPKTYAERCELLASTLETPLGWAFAGVYARGCDLVVFNPHHHIETGSAPVIVVKAFEDDTWFSEDTRAKARFALEWASTIALLDPSGYLDLVVGLVDLGWSLLCFLDDIDQDDPLGTQVWEIDESTIPNTDTSTQSHVLSFQEESGDNHWKLGIEAVFYDPMTP